MDLAVALAGGVRFGVERLVAVGRAWDGGAVEGLAPLADGWALYTAVEESFGVVSSGWTVRDGGG